MFYGEFLHSIDRKGRLILPSKFREVSKTHFVEKFYVTRGLDKCLFMFAEEEWKAQESKFRAIPFTKQESRTFNRLYFSGAVEMVPDRQGRVPFAVPQGFCRNKKGSHYRRGLKQDRDLVARKVGRVLSHHSPIV
jgi:MraZ protein